MNSFLILSRLQSGTEEVVRLDEALAAIAEEREACALGVWISVNDALPPASAQYDLMYYSPKFLVSVSEGPRTINGGRIVEPVLISHFTGLEFFGGWEYNHVTHWMPLPAAPMQSPG